MFGPLSLGAGIGIIIGGTVGLLLLAAGIVWCMRRSRLQQSVKPIHA